MQDVSAGCQRVEAPNMRKLPRNECSGTLAGNLRMFGGTEGCRAGIVDRNREYRVTFRFAATRKPVGVLWPTQSRR